MKNIFLKTVLILTTIFTTISGVTYLYIQYIKTKSMIDFGYVILLIISTNFLFFGILWIFKYINKVIEENELLELFNSFVTSLNSNKSLIFGILFGLVVVFAFAIILNVWQDNLLLKILLSLFQFFVGVICGFGIYQLFNFIYNIREISKKLNISFFNLHSPEIFFVLNSIQFIALLTSAYVSISMTSILFSNLFDFSNVYIKLYSIFSFSFILISYMIPLLPISQKIKKTKNKTLFEIERKLLEIYELEINTGKATEEELTKFESFINFRSEILAINSWPFTNKWLSTVAGVLLAALAPILIDMLIN